VSFVTFLKFRPTESRPITAAEEHIGPIEEQEPICSGHDDLPSAIKGGVSEVRVVANLIDHPGRGDARPIVVEEQDPVTGGDDVGPEVEARMALQVPVRPVGPRPGEI
jgi:hypothetical protein